MKKILWIVGGLLVLLILVAGNFVLSYFFMKHFNTVVADKKPALAPVEEISVKITDTSSESKKNLPTVLKKPNSEVKDLRAKVKKLTKELEAARKKTEPKKVTMAVSTPIPAPEPVISVVNIREISEGGMSFIDVCLKVEGLGSSGLTVEKYTVKIDGIFQPWNSWIGSNSDTNAYRLERPTIQKSVEAIVELSDGARLKSPTYKFPQ